MTEKFFPVYLNTQLYRTFSGSLEDLIVHLQTEHFDPKISLKIEFSKAWEFMFKEAENPKTTFDYINKYLNDHDNTVNSFIFRILNKTAKKIIDDISHLDVLRMGCPSIQMHFDFNFCSNLNKNLIKMQENLFFGKFKMILPNNCNCRTPTHNVNQNYLSSFFYLLNDSYINFTKILITLLNEGYELNELQNFCQLFHHILPVSYRFDRYR